MSSERNPATSSLTPYYALLLTVFQAANFATLLLAGLALAEVESRPGQAVLFREALPGGFAVRILRI